MRGEPRSGCPINMAVEALGDPWSLIVLRDMMFGDRRYFRELLAGSDEGIASNVLSSRTPAEGNGRHTRSPRRASRPSRCSWHWAPGAAPTASPLRR